MRKYELEGRTLRSRVVPTTTRNDDTDSDGDDDGNHDENDEGEDPSEDEEEDISEFVEAPRRR